METFLITKPSDAIQARERAREMAKNLGFGLVDQTKLAFAVSEMALKLIAIADVCRMNIDYFLKEEKAGIEVSMYERHRMAGPVDTQWAAQLVDDLDVSHNRFDETRITFRKWRKATESNDCAPCKATATGGKE
ncbi:hypothetical protein BG53_11390 [Paenibacillus darwinianus]|uniref:Uncharacterized protein n=1 Tax=Paenibacillus darwinianus TaxID=1380763 RepID=A0A9W5W8C3_9BACL|nr:hypothetical protein [Paenibacillus darwinianus]EXX87734.1 hypothetical protein BG52_03530 [Paenibacillus darwinianus]EXX91453.1 hypothetical protein BG53_11390 [Paenibacillus darwinianus]EXX92201.1 hypothetical protein CH50_11770 [Paenibacillus darwinianus]